MRNVNKLILLLSLALLTGCGIVGDTKESTPEIVVESPVIEYTPATTIEPAAFLETELPSVQYDEAKLILEELIPEGLAMYGRYRQRILPYLEAESVGDYHKLGDAETIESIKADLTGVFTDAVAQSDFYSYMFDLEQYLEFDGGLYVNPSFGVLMWRSSFDLDTFELMSWEDTTIVVQVEQRLQEDVCVTRGTKVIRLIKQEDGWRIDSSLI